MNLKITLFGGLAIERQGKPVEALSTRKTEALLVYLACNRQEHTRDVLATLLWEDQSQVKALTSLRAALTNLRKRLEAYLTISRGTLGIHPHADIWLDVQQFDQHMHLGEYEQAIALYRGDFLQGFYLRNSALFEDWVRQERERYRTLFESGLHSLVEDCLQKGLYPKAIDYSRQLLQANPLDEAAHRDLMLSLAYDGQRIAALAQYESLRETLQHELQIEPDEEAVVLYQQIREGMPQIHRKETTFAEMKRRFPLPTGTVTFLFTDIEGSTPLWEQHPQEMAEALQIHNRALRQAIESNGGVVFKTVGDAFQSSFATAIQALKAAIEGQQALQAAAWNELGPLKVRMGLHTGEAELDPGGDEYAVSHTKNRIGRIHNSAHGSQILLSQETYDLVVRQLPKGVSLKDLDEHRLKGMQWPEHLYQVNAPGLPQDFPPLVTTIIHPNNLPLHPGKVILSVHPFIFFDENAQERFQAGPFVAREGELATLDGFLAQMRTGHAQAVFISGSAGQGKSTLIQAFVRRATEGDPDLLAVQGACNAYSGLGDAYLPFRDVMGMLTGDVESLYTAGAIRREHALRLWNAMPDTLQALMEHGENLLDVLVPGERLLSRVASSIHRGTPAAQALEQALRKGKAGSSSLEQSHVFEQLTNVLREIAAVHPLVIALDDMQWADTASTSLLFHIGRRLQASRVLILCAYRPEEMTQSAEGERHPLEKILSEFKRQYGDTCIDLGEAEKVNGRIFIDAFLATEPNQLGERFRQTLFNHTKGHPLFTIELLRAMQERGDLLQQAGVWVEGPALDWEALPPRVEAVIEERIGRLEAELRDILTIASVEGEDFTAQVVARVQKADERKLIQQLGQELSKRHHLVGEEGVRLSGKLRLYRYRFQHGLFQQYIYHSLGENERGVLHEEVANVLEALYAGHEDEIAPQLAYHYRLSGNREKAVIYLTMAGLQAQARYASQEAVEYFDQGLAWTDITNREARYKLLLAREKVFSTQGMREKEADDLAVLEALVKELGDASKQADVALRRAIFEEETSNYPNAIAAAKATIQFAQEGGVQEREAEGYLEYGSALMRQGEYEPAREKLMCALELAKTAQIKSVMALSLTTLGILEYERNNFDVALEYQHECLEIFREIGDRINAGHSLNSLGTANLSMGNYTDSEGYFEQAWSIFRETGNRHGEATVLNNLAQLYFSLANFSRVMDFYERALNIFREIGHRMNESIILDNIGETACFQADYTKGYTCYQQALDLCRQIGSRPGEEIALCGLGSSLYGLGNYIESERCLQQALDLGAELGMQDYVLEARSGLARAFLAQEQLSQACQQVSEILAVLDSGYSPSTEIFPFRLYWTCYQVLRASQDPRARNFLETTYRLLCKQVEAIREQAARRAFLENIPWHRAIMAEAKNLF